MHCVSVVIPTLNEADALPLLLDDLEQQSDVNLEVVVADGGSTDATPHIAQQCAKLVRCTHANRAAQLNEGARQAGHDWLVFLHADTRLTGVHLLRDAISTLSSLPENTAGHFSLRFEGARSDHLGFRYLEAKTRESRPFTVNGDQGFVMRRSLFEALGAFDPTLGFFEDQRLAARVWELGNWVTLPGVLVTSSRRFDAEGFERRYLAMAMMMGAHHAGALDFFGRVRAYAPHPEAALDLAPFFRAAWDMTLARTEDEAAALWLDVGQYIRMNAWQLALMTDTYLLEDPDHPTLHVFEKHLQPALNRKETDVMLAIAAATCFLVALPAVWAAKGR